MTTQEIIGKIKQRRQGNIAKSNSGLKDDINALRRLIVENSFSKSPDMGKHRDLMLKLEDAKERLKQITAFGG